MIRLIALIMAVWTGAATAAVDERSEKSYMFAGRCLLALLEGRVVDAEGLQDRDYTGAQGVPIDFDGFAYPGKQPGLLLIENSDGHCGINVEGESADEMAEFLAFWFGRAGSTITLTNEVTLPNGDMQIDYVETCDDCSSWLEAVSYWSRAHATSYYRVFSVEIIEE